MVTLSDGEGVEVHPEWIVLSCVGLHSSLFTIGVYVISDLNFIIIR